MQTQMTDVDQLSTSSDVVEVFKQLTKIMRDVESLPDNAQVRFWDDTNRDISEVPAEDLRIGQSVSARSVTVLYNVLANIHDQWTAALGSSGVSTGSRGALTRAAIWPRTFQSCAVDDLPCG